MGGVLKTKTPLLLYIGIKYMELAVKLFRRDSLLVLAKPDVARTAIVCSDHLIVSVTLYAYLLVVAQ